MYERRRSNDSRVMPVAWTRRRLLSTAVIAGVVMAASSRAAGSEPRFGSTFLQLLQEHSQWTPAQWNALFDSLHELGIRRVILQWSQSDGIHFSAPESPAPPLKLLLDSAAAHGVSILVGLAHDPGYWRAISQPLDKVTAYLSAREAQAIRAAGEVATVASGHEAFGGWFLTDEIDDINWRSRETSQLLFAYLRRVADFFHAAAPGLPVAISGFCNGIANAGDLRDFWSALLGAVPVINILMFQDGVGAHKLTVSNLAPYFAAVRAAAQAARVKMWAVVELFDQRAGPPIDAAPFAAVAAPVARVLEQMQGESGFADELVAFSIPEYMLATDMTNARQLLIGYKGRR